MHIIKTAKIQNITKRYILLPIRGNLKLKSGGIMSELHLYFFNDGPWVEADDRGADILLIIF